VFILELAEKELERRGARSLNPARGREGGLREVRLTGPSPPSLPPYAGPPIVSVSGEPRLEVVVGQGPAREITQILTIRG